MNDNEQLLKAALTAYKNKWESARESLDKTFEEDIKLHIKYTTQIYLAQWIINSINGGLDKPHGTNICNILRD